MQNEDKLALMGIRASSRHLMHLCRNLTVYHSIQQKTFVKEPGILILKETISEIIETFDVQGKHENIDLLFEPLENIPYSVNVDAMHIASALESIILQASYYSSPNRNIIVDCWVDSPKTFDFQLSERRTSKANA